MRPVWALGCALGASIGLGGAAHAQTSPDPTVPGQQVQSQQVQEPVGQKPAVSDGVQALPDAEFDALFADLPPIPDVDSLPPVDFGEAIILDPVPPVDPALFATLPSLTGFRPQEGSDFEITGTEDQGVRYQVALAGLEETGTEPRFRELSALIKGQDKEATPAQLVARTNNDKALLTRILESEGWYASNTRIDMRGLESARADVKFQVTPGARYHWNSITLDLIPDEKSELAADFRLKVGAPIRASEVEEAEGALLLKLQESGYPFAEIGARDVLIDDETSTGAYLLTGDIGARGVFGRIILCASANCLKTGNPTPLADETVAKMPFDATHAGVIARFGEGDLYDTRLTDDFRRALIATQQFSGVTVTAFNTNRYDSEGRIITDILVAGQQGPQKRLAGQLGYSSEEGVRAEGSWQHRSFIQPEGNLISRAVLGTQEQRLGTELSLSNWRVRDRTLAFGAEIANLTPVAYSAQTVNISANLSRLSTPIWQKLWTWSLGLTLGASRERARATSLAPGITPLPGIEDDPYGLNERRNFLFVSMPTSIGYDRSNDLLDPVRGYRIKLEATPELSREGNHFESYGRVFLEAAGYKGFGEKFVLAGRVKTGSIIGAELKAIAPTRRLYAGGGGSVRGYEYQSVGMLDAYDRPIGGRSLLEGSIEGRYRMGALGFVAFVDAGSVTPDSMPGFKYMKYGAGVGARYYTAMGPIRVDLARAINRTSRDPAVALYISIGQSF